METMKKLKEIISRQTEIEEEKLTESTTMEDIMADSLDTVELLMSVEESFDIEITDTEAQKLSNLGELCSLVEEKLLM